MIKRLAVKKLNDKLDFNVPFNDDLNILTGRNGSGKTTVLKLLWYVIGGNLERVIPEIRFTEMFIETDKFELKLNVARDKDSDRVKKVSSRLKIGKDVKIKELQEEEYSDYLNDLNYTIIKLSEGSLFFPTFRRIEGGFTRYSAQNQTNSSMKNRSYSRGMRSLQEAMSDFSSETSVFHHRFIASISTHDIDELLTQKYAEVSRRTNAFHGELSTFITGRIQDYESKPQKSKAKQHDTTTILLNDIQEKVNEVTKRREELLRPFSVLTSLIQEVLQHKAIQVTEGITLGEAKESISSDKLSAGEKQMLSFLCYNAFSTNHCIFIDEPELSLHVDWQRLLFPTLLEQDTKNQFIIATHSPFIYSKYPDKEIVLADDKGGI